MRTGAAAAYLRDYQDRPLTLMEICGSHTAVLEKYAIRDLLSPHLNLVSGPGCPVCVTPTAEINRLQRLAMLPGCTVACFADLLRIPGSRGTLQQAMARGGSVRTFLSPLEVAGWAAARPEQLFLVAAIGFETTAPLYARLLDQVLAADLTNVRLVSSLRLMPPVLRHLLDQPGCPDGFLAPGHVCTIIGSRPFEPLAASAGRPFVIAGFTPDQVMLSLAHLAGMAARGEAAVRNDYPQLVTMDGNLLAQSALAKYFRPVPMLWRGLGLIQDSGLDLKPEYSALGWAEEPVEPDTQPAAQPDSGLEGASLSACRCGDVLAGRLRPRECAAFGRICRPEQPLGPCMVSSEGACGLAYAYNREAKS